MFREKVSKELMSSLVKQRDDKKLAITKENKEKSQFLNNLREKMEQKVYSRDFQTQLFKALEMHINHTKELETIDQVSVTVSAYLCDTERLVIDFKTDGVEIDSCGCYPDYIQFDNDDYVAMVNAGAKFLEGALKEFGFVGVHILESDYTGNWDNKYHFYDGTVVGNIPMT